jgi:hypothetical protein
VFSELRRVRAGQRASRQRSLRPGPRRNRPAWRLVPDMTRAKLTHRAGIRWRTGRLAFSRCWSLPSEFDRPRPCRMGLDLRQRSNLQLDLHCSGNADERMQTVEYVIQSIEAAATSADGPDSGSAYRACRFGLPWFSWRYSRRLCYSLFSSGGVVLRWGTCRRWGSPVHCAGPSAAGCGFGGPGARAGLG